MKKIAVVVVSLMLCLCFAVGTVAHPNNQMGLVTGGDANGWGICEDHHTNGTAFTYKVLESGLKSDFAAGAALWSGIVTITESSSAIGTIGTFSDYTNTAVATTHHDAMDSSGHLTAWRIEVNLARYNAFSAIVAAHEFGHVIGLKDLTSNSNIDKLMYGTTASTATGPTVRDIYGEKVISGQHPTHNFLYTQATPNPSGNWHYARCSACFGLPPGTDTYTGLQFCKYEAGSNYCYLCGLRKYGV